MEYLDYMRKLLSLLPKYGLIGLGIPVDLELLHGQFKPLDLIRVPSRTLVLLGYDEIP
jgi:hypothetical protein